MSWQMTALVKSLMVGVPPALKLLAMILADYADPEGGDIFPSIARLARDTGMSERSVERHMAKLREMGFVSLVGNSRGGSLPRTGSKGKMGRSNRYRINAEWWKGSPDKLTGHGSEAPSNGSDAPTESGSYPDTAVAPKYSIEYSPSVEALKEVQDELKTQQLQHARDQLTALANSLRASSRRAGP